ncbi:Cerato-platanin [Zopfochytrium polystomum]|nr:Cerato-platanin [Zopfochytrium polystomum]
MLVSFTAAAVAALSLLVPAASATPARVSYNPMYSNTQLGIGGLTCAPYLSQFGTTLGSVPVKPGVFYAASANLAGLWNSPNCGSCYSLSYNGKTVYVVAIDACGDGFLVSTEGLDALTGGKAVELGGVTADAQPVDKTNCFK